MLFATSMCTGRRPGIQGERVWRRRGAADAGCQFLRHAPRDRGAAAAHVRRWQHCERVQVRFMMVAAPSREKTLQVFIQVTTQLVK